MRPIRILELRSVVGSGGGPEKTILLGTARTNPTEFAVTVCYFRDLRDAQYDLAGRAAALGVDYAELIERHSLDPAIWPALKALCREKQTDVIHSHEYKTDLLALAASRALGIVPLATAHGWTGHSWRERMLYYPADKRLLARFPRVIAVSGEIREELVRHGASPERVRVILNGIDPQAFRRDDERRPEVRDALQVGPTDFVIGSVGRLEPQKRFDLLIDAVASLASRHPSLRLLIAGEGSSKSDLQTQIDRLGVGAVCRLLGHQRDVPRLHHAFDLYVQSSDYEGTPNSVLEAMAMETPVVATAAGGTAELIETGVHGLVVPTGSASSLAEGIASMMADPAHRDACRRAARARVEGPLSFEARMRAVESIYRELVPSPALSHARA